jgi:hypothetical protein
MALLPISPMETVPLSKGSLSKDAFQVPVASAAKAEVEGWMFGHFGYNPAAQLRYLNAQHLRVKQGSRWVTLARWRLSFRNRAG